MPQLLGQILGALIATFLVSRLTLWLLRKWDGGLARIALAHGTALAFCWVAYAFGSADGGPLNWSGGAIYTLPQIFWLVVDMLRGRGKAQEAPGDLNSDHI